MSDSTRSSGSAPSGSTPADLADAPTWFRELSDGGRTASRLDPAVRDALALVTTDVAAEVAETTRQRRAAEEAQRREEEAAERSRQLAEQQREREALNARSAQRVRDAFVALGGRLIAAAVLVGGTPVIASFITISPIGPNLTPVVFFGSETGSTSGDGPWTLYGILITAALVTVGICFVADLVFGPPRRGGPAGVVLGALLGLGIFITQWATNTLTGSSWWIAPILIAAGYLMAAVTTGEKDLLPATGATSTRRRDIVVTVLMSLVMLSLVVPWWAGTLMEGSTLLPSDPRIVNPQIRDVVDYRLAYVVAGLVPLGGAFAVVIAAVTLRRRPRFAAGAIVLGAAIAVTAAVVTPSVWSATEARAVDAYRWVPYDFAACETGCSFLLEDSGSGTVDGVLWTTLVTEESATIYRAWTEVASIAQPDPAIYEQSYIISGPSGGPAVDGSALVLRTVDNRLVGFSLDDGIAQWESNPFQNLGRPPEVVTAGIEQLYDTREGIGIVVFDGDDTNAGSVVGIAGQSGVVAWLGSCPNGGRIERQPDWLSGGWVTCTLGSDETYYRVQADGSFQ